MFGISVCLFPLPISPRRLSFSLIMAHNVMRCSIQPLFNLPNGLRAAGDARFTMVMGIASMLVFRPGTA